MSVTATNDRSLNALTEVEEPAEMGVSFGTFPSPQIHFASRGEIRPEAWVLRRIPSNRS